MTDFITLRQAIAADLRDPDNKVFSDTDIGYFVNAGIAEIGRIAPRRFQEDIDLVANQFEYIVLNQQIDAFVAATPEVELTRVELWDTTQTPHAPLRLIAPSSQAYVNYSDTGWTLTDGVLELPRWVLVHVGENTDSFLLRVWGYAPYPQLSDPLTVVPLSYEKEWALRSYVRVEALQRLISERDLFTQWQTRAGNTDTSPASLMNGYNVAMEDWRRKSRAIAVLREAPG